MRWYLTGFSLGDLSKELGILLGMRRDIAGKKTGGLAIRLLEVVGVCGSKPPRQWLTARTIDYKRRPTVDDG
ncbi:hypothetical protein BHM03_00038155 [Ensete ventricosum]|nr:hypothetical protein BHM03_00038155 [Ensete ventricosum]